jgi:hypothetical protein
MEKQQLELQKQQVQAILEREIQWDGPGVHLLAWMWIWKHPRDVQCLDDKGASSEWPTGRSKKSRGSGETNMHISLNSIYRHVFPSVGYKICNKILWSPSDV